MPENFQPSQPVFMVDKSGRKYVQVTPDSVEGYVASFEDFHTETAAYVKNSWAGLEQRAGSLAAVTFLLDEHNLPIRWLGSLAAN